ncbi:hypothetical protein GCM10007108_05150 [Thermogymnomonas acidicola]|uniref:Uncharacterized protein n=1 Tax=Thermogymnomonas acidicola TaxID=399579 RepID=A0AA37BQG8_9ARCH|nr:hypothetical protein [Thermogymnomonas acidicola]GGM70011.1 hypothetical protein GCM10007108_05150 [Thermogymnomonas acidicola]
MNRKTMIAIVALVATLLPAVAVADVMVQGFVNGNSQAVPDAFYVQPGSNYMQAHSAAGFTWMSKSVSESEILGNITLGFMTNETIYEVNVLDVNFSSGASGDFNITVTVPSGVSGTVAFPEDTAMWVSNEPFTLSYSGIHFASGSTTYEFNLASPGTTSEVFDNVNHSTHLYIAFVVGAGPADESYSFLVTMSLLSS